MASAQEQQPAASEKLVNDQQLPPPQTDATASVLIENGVGGPVPPPEPQPQEAGSLQERSGKRERPLAGGPLPVVDNQNVSSAEGDQKVVEAPAAAQLQPNTNGGQETTVAEHLPVEAAEARKGVQQVAAATKVDALTAAKEAADEVVERAAKLQKLSEESTVGEVDPQQGEKKTGQTDVQSAVHAGEDISPKGALEADANPPENLLQTNGAATVVPTVPVSAMPQDQSLVKPPQDPAPLKVTPKTQLTPQEQGPAPMQVG